MSCFNLSPHDMHELSKNRCERECAEKCAVLSKTSQSLTIDGKKKRRRIMLIHKALFDVSTGILETFQRP